MEFKNYISINTTGEAIVDSNNRTIKDIPFNQYPIQDGLVFWSNTQSQNIVLIDGKVYQAYDIRDTNHTNSLYMVQNSSTNRPIYNYYYKDSTIRTQSTSLYLNSSQSSVMKSAFLIGRTVEVGGDSAASQNSLLGTQHQHSGIGGSSGAIRYQLGGSNFKRAYVNNSLYTNCNVNIGVPNYFIIHTAENMNLSTPVTLGYGVNNGSISILEWGWYNRVLNDAEVIYNINALNQKYNIY